jgi:serine/threonine-protein kinase
VAVLSHPNILAIHHFATEDGLTYAVMELLEGETLRARLTRSGLGWRQAAEIGLATAEGLSAAHAKGVVHRDIKPENIFLTSAGLVKILDFGLARLEPIAWVNTSTVVGETANPITRSLVMGTPGYMSPEQVRGEIAEAPSDIFSFGCMLFEMLNGQAPFARGTVTETNTATLNNEPPTPTGAGTPAELDVLVRRCLEKNPKDRFQSANALTANLTTLLSGRDKAIGSSRRARAAWFAGALVVLLLSAVTWRLTLQSRPVIGSLAVLPLVNEGGEGDTEYFSDGVTESLINSLSQLPGLRVPARGTTFRYRAQSDPQKSGRELGVDAVLVGSVRQRGDSFSVQVDLVKVADGSQLWGDHYNRKLADIFAVQDEIASQIVEKLRTHLTGPQKRRLTKRYTESPEAYQLYLKGRFFFNKRSVAGLERAIGHFQEAIAKDPTYALAYAGIADSYASRGVPEAFLGGVSPREAFPPARAAALKALELDDTIAEPHISLAHIKYVYDWDWAGADREMQRALELDPNSSVAHHFYGLFLSPRGRHEEAIAQIKRALEIDSFSPLINSNLALVLYRAHRYDEAMQQARATVEMDESFAMGHHRLGLVLEQKSMYAEATAEFKRVVELSGGQPLALAGLGHSYAISGNTDAAKRVLNELRELSKTRYVSSYLIATIHAGLGEKEQAFAGLERAFDDRSTSLVPLNVDPNLDSIRSDPRFAALVRRRNLTP